MLRDDALEILLGHRTQKHRAIVPHIIQAHHLGRATRHQPLEALAALRPGQRAQVGAVDLQDVEQPCDDRRAPRSRGMEIRTAIDAECDQFAVETLWREDGSRRGRARGCTN